MQNSVLVPKNENFYADFKAIELVVIKFTEKVTDR